MAITSGTHSVGTGETLTNWDDAAAEVAGQTLTGPVIFETSAAEKITGNTTFSCTTSATNTLTLRAGSGFEHNGVRGAGSIYYDNSPGGFGTFTFAANCQHWEIRDLELVQDGANSFAVRVTGANTITGSYGLIDRCMIYSSETSDDATMGAHPRMEGAAWAEYDYIEFRNSIIVGSASSGINGNGSDTTQCRVNYCTIVKTMTDADSFTSGCRYCTAKNTYVGHFGGELGWDDYLNENASSANYASHDGSGSVPSLAIADQFTDVTASAWDLSLKSGSDLEGAGATISGITVDIAGNTRDGTTPDIGAFEFGAGAGSIIPQAMFHYRNNSGSGL